MQWKVPQNGNVGALHDSKLQTFFSNFAVFPVQFVECMYTVTLLGTSRERLLVKNVYYTIRKMIPLFYYNTGVTLLRPLLAWPRAFPGRAVEAGPKDVRLRESWLYYHSKRESGVMGEVGQRKNCKNGKGTWFSFLCLLLWRPRVLTIYTN